MNNKSFTKELRVRQTSQKVVRFAITTVVQSNYLYVRFIHKHKENITARTRDSKVVHVISAKHFTSGYQSEILHAVYIPSKFRNSTGRQPVNPQMWSGRSKLPTSQCKICKLL